MVFGFELRLGLGLCSGGLSFGVLGLGLLWLLFSLRLCGCLGCGGWVLWVGVWLLVRCG